MSLKQHYYLVAGKVVFFIGDPSEENNEAKTIELNSILTTVQQQITEKDIGKSQQVLQMMAVQKINEPNIKFVHVYIHGYSYLGHMKPETFSKPNIQLDRPSEDILEAAPLAN